MRKILKLNGCLTWTFTIIGFVYYIIMIVDLFSKGVSGGLGFLLVTGAIAIIVIGSGLGWLFFLESKNYPTCKCEIHKDKKDN